jgi:hypothetical protein
MNGKISLWDDKQENMCGYCVFGEPVAGAEQVVCRKRRNIYDFECSCNKFKFDILKKNVRRQRLPDFSKFSPENFKI